MDELDRIKLENYQAIYNDTNMAMECYKVLREGLVVSNERLDELIEYAIKKEMFEAVNRLIKKKVDDV